MLVPEFYELFIGELKENENLRTYYKHLNDDSRRDFRKAHFCQRLEFIQRNLKDTSSRIWDVGCGYGTTDIFLALNGFTVYGSTLEFYYKQIEPRLEYWSKFGDVSKFTAGYENIFDIEVIPDTYDCIIVQDTLHHLEPLADALKIFNTALSENGKLLVSEVNGNNLFERFKFFLQRGNKRIIKIYDEKLDKWILFGNENIRPLKTWNKELNAAGFEIDNDILEYIRFYPPGSFKNGNYEKLIEKEQKALAKE